MNPFGHIEIPTADLAKAKKFYGAVFGWTFTHVPDIDYTLIHTGKHPGGGFEVVRKLPAKPQVKAYVEVADIDAALKAIRKARGKVLSPKSPVGTMGWRATFASPEGVVLCLWQSAQRV